MVRISVAFHTHFGERRISMVRRIGAWILVCFVLGGGLKSYANEKAPMQQDSSIDARENRTGEATLKDGRIQLAVRRPLTALKNSKFA